MPHPKQVKPYNFATLEGLGRLLGMDVTTLQDLLHGEPRGPAACYAAEVAHRRGGAHKEIGASSRRPR